MALSGPFQEELKKINNLPCRRSLAGTVRLARLCTVLKFVCILNILITFVFVSIMAAILELFEIDLSSIIIRHKLIIFYLFNIKHV